MMCDAKIKRIAAFSKYLAYDVGGAEKSTLALLNEQQSDKKAKITIVSQANAKFLSGSPSLTEMKINAELVFLQGGVQFSRFPFYEYLLNRGRIINWFSSLDADELWTYGVYSPAAMLGFKGKVRYFVRSETDLGIVANYFNGLKRTLKTAYTAVEWPAIKLHQNDLRESLRRATVVANSKYMSTRVRERFGIDASVIYPMVDVSSFRRELAATQVEQTWVVFVGDSIVKGLQHVLAAAKLLPQLQFRIFSRFVQDDKHVGNILWSPWQKESWRVYSGARLVIVPSQWEEAYGRVARESYLLGLPTLVSNVGGLPEAVDGNSCCLVDDYRRVESWVDAIVRTLNV